MLKRAVIACVGCALLFAGCALPTRAQSTTGNLTAQGASCGSTTSTSSVIAGVTSVTGSVGFNLSGTWSGTVTFYASGDNGASWNTISVTPSNSTTTVTSSTSNGLWHANGAGYTRFCMLMSSYSSGTAVATITLSSASASRIGQGGGASGGITLTGGCSGYTGFCPTDTSIEASFTSAASGDTELYCGAHSGPDNGVLASATSHSIAVPGLTPNTGYSCYVKSGALFSNAQNVTTNAAQTRIPIAQAQIGTTIGNGQQVGDGIFSCQSNDGHDYVSQGDGEGFAVASGTYSNMQVGILDNLGTLIGSNVNALTAYGGGGTSNGTDGPGGEALSDKLDGLFCMNANLFGLHYRGGTGPTHLWIPAVQSGTIIASANHGTSWNNFQAPGTYAANGSVETPLGSFQFASQLIGAQTWVRYGADTGTMGYLGDQNNAIDGADAYVYMLFAVSQDPTHAYLMRCSRGNLLVSNCSSGAQYWTGPAPASVTPANFVLDSNWSSSGFASKTAIFTDPNTAAQFDELGEMTFVSDLNSYVLVRANVYTQNATDLFDPTVDNFYSCVTPAGPCTAIGGNAALPGWYAPSIAHSTIAGNSATHDINTTVITASFPEAYKLHTYELALNPTTTNMTQLQNYAMNTVENPISEGGLWTSDANRGGVQVAASGNGFNVAEASNTVGTVSAYTGPPVAGDTGAPWPNDQAAAITFSAHSSTSAGGGCVRFTAATSTGYCVDAANGTSGILKLSNGAGAFVCTTSAYAPAVGDTVTISAVGTTISASYTNATNAYASTSICSGTDATYASGNPGIFLGDSSGVANTQSALWTASARQADAPTFSSYTTAGAITLTSATSSATIYYTTDGTQPTRSSSTISSGSSVTVTAGQKLTAMAAATDFADSNPVCVQF